MASCAWSCGNGRYYCEVFEDCRHRDQMSRLTTEQLNWIDDWREKLDKLRCMGTHYTNPLRMKFHTDPKYGLLTSYPGPGLVDWPIA